MKLLLELGELTMKQAALKLQSTLLDDPMGHLLNVELHHVKRKDAVDGTSIKVVAGSGDDYCFVLTVHDEFDSERDEPFGEAGIRFLILTPTHGFMEAYPKVDAGKQQFVARVFDREEGFQQCADDLLNRFCVKPMSNSGDSFFDGNELLRAFNDAKTFVLSNGDLYRVDRAATAENLKAGDIVLANARDRTVCMFEIVKFEADKFEADSIPELKRLANVSSMQKLYNKYEGNVQAHVRDPARGSSHQGSTEWLRIRKSGATVGWSLNQSFCSLTKMRKV